MGLIKRDVEQKVSKIIGFQCNRCKNEFDESEVVEMQEALHWKTIGGYGSVWGDGNTVELSLCQQCTLDLFESFATIHD